jgi:hypothetical protein
MLFRKGFLFPRSWFSPKKKVEAPDLATVKLPPLPCSHE